MSQRFYATFQAATPDGNFDVFVTMRAKDRYHAACFDYYPIIRILAGVMPDHDDAADIACEIADQAFVHSVRVTQRDEDPAFGVLVLNEECK